MHDTAMEIGCLVMNRYSDLARARVLELGSYDVNGSLRNNIPKTTDYVGLDLEPGPGVDFVVEPGKPWPVEDDSFDLVIASSVFEHDSMFWMTFLQMVKKARKGGYVYISAPSNGSVHRYPEDHWRFYPDSGLALERWAESQGEPVRLVESFTAGRKGDEWNDFVAVFRKGRSKQDLPQKFVYQELNSFNVLTWQSGELLKPSEKTEDRRIIDEAHDKLRELDEKVNLITWENQQNWDERQKAERELLLAEARLAQEQSGHEVSRSRLIDLGANLERQAAALREAESKLVDHESRFEELNGLKCILESQLSERQAAIDVANDRVATQQAKIEEYEQLRASLEANLAERATALELLEAAIAEQRNLAERHEGTSKVLEALLVERSTALEQAQAAMAQQQEAAEREARAKVELAAELRNREEAMRGQSQELAQLRDKFALTESTLLQRQEEIEQTRAEATNLQVEHNRMAVELDQANERLKQASERLKEANDWVFKLAGERQHWQSEAERATRKLAKVEAAAKTDLAKLQDKAQRSSSESSALTEEVARIRGELADLKTELATARSRLAEAEKSNRSLDGDRDRALREAARLERQVADHSAELAAITKMLRTEQEAHSAIEREREALIREAAETANKLTGANDRVNDLESQLDDAKTALEDARSRQVNLEDERDCALADASQATRGASERLTEIVTLTRFLEIGQRDLDARQQRIDWLRQVNLAMQSAPRWWHLLPKSWKRKRELRRLGRLGLFDAQGYLGQYRDVFDHGMDPLEHYILHGLNEGRSL